MQNRRLAELLGICWHEFDSQHGIGGPYCCKCKRTIKQQNPDFTDPRLVLDSLDEKGLLDGFIDYLVSRGLAVDDKKSAKIDVGLIRDKTGKLRSMAIAFLEKDAH
jgi:hypothetical protein